ncbi:putative LRR receptor-like serine/threonine-protein kinase [Arachis hypogaea]|nr:putative LRR receptor-like serine/threonine-protein kinase [Arachis hypogaea]
MMVSLIMFLLSIASQTLAVHVALSSETDKIALLALKDKLTNGNHDALPSWNESLHFCEWQGVTCSRRRMRVTALILQNQYWGGTLAPSLGNLTFLKAIFLTNIHLRGEIPREIGHLKRLQILDLKQNNLHGQIPMQMINCSSLYWIILTYNNLTGKVPSWFGSMVQLTHLGIAVNSFVGSIPPSLGNLSSLEQLSLTYNHLEGSITPALGRLSNLNFLALGGNKFSGQVPYSLYNLSNIQVFSVTDNQLVGNTLLLNIPMAFPYLREFTCGGNRFTGTFPSSISNLSELQVFDIGDNGFHGPISPKLGSLHKLQIFFVPLNRFGSGRAYDLDFLFSLVNCTQLQKLVIEENYLGGVLTDTIGNLSSNLDILVMGSNQISGKIPEGIGKLINLKTLGMERNSLEGIIPYSIGKLKNMVRLTLQENKLYGKIPLVIGNLTMLSEVQLYSNKFEGIIPFTLGNCTKMEIFYAHENNLSGNIPNQTFGYQQGLIALSLFSNSFTGPIPSELGNLIHLSVLYLQENKLIGEIPMELSACSALTELVLESNLIHGSIPSFLGSLLSLEILDLSNNNFSSTISHELVNLKFLSMLNLSFNHLSGEVPEGGVFNNITAISLFGNKDLCGGIPQLNLSACPMLPLQKKHKRSLKKRVILFIAFGGVLISFVAFISIYLFKKKAKKLSTTSLALQYGYVKVSYGELHQATNGFSSSNLVGTGTFGSVYRGNLVHFKRPVAVKVLNLQTHGASKSFMAECKALGKIKHRNLLSILTCCSSVDYNGNDFKAIVFDFMSNGSLETLLHNRIEDSESTNLSLNLMQRVNIALDVAFALDYLHNDLEKAVVHCDIKPSNVLLDNEVVAHLGDFGLARLVHGAASRPSSGQATSSTIKGTVGYIPPEYGAGASVSAEGDMYSYGILLLEMLTGKKPTDTMFAEGLSLHNFCNAATLERITEIVDSRLLIPIAKQEGRRVTSQQNMEGTIQECLVSFAKIGIACSEEVPTQRMSIKNVIKELHAIKQKLFL